MQLIETEKPAGQIIRANSYLDPDPRTPGVDTLRRIYEEIRYQPLWRREADRCTNYYDGNQLTPDDLQRLNERGMAPLITNLIAPVINLVTGMEVKLRTDARAVADEDDAQELAEAISVKLMEAKRETDLNDSFSEAFESQVKAGLGWLEVSRESDPFLYRYRVKPIRRHEIWWDWHAKERDLSDARWLMRRRWYDLDAAVAHFPEQADVLTAAGRGWSAFDAEAALNLSSPQLVRAFEVEQSATLEEMEWRDQSRNRVCISELWTRVWSRTLVIVVGERAIEFDLRNPAHQVAVARGVAKPLKVSVPRVRVDFYAGPHHLTGGFAKGRDFPYIPLWAYREDTTGISYGLVRAMIGPQDEVNARRQKMMHLLSSKRVQMDSDALDTRYNTFLDVMREIAKPDAAIIRNPERRNERAIDIDDQAELGAQQFQIMQENKQALQEAVGVFHAALGDSRSMEGQSGVAKQTLIEQSTTVLAKIFANAAYAKRKVYERLMGYIVDDLGTTPTVIRVSDGSRRKSVYVNQPAQDPETGIAYLRNDVSRANLKIAIEDIQTSPAYRQHRFTMLSEVVRALPPQIQASVMDFWIEASELPNREEIADRVRKLSGFSLPPEDGDMTPAEQQEFAAMQAQQQLQQRAVMADLAQKEAAAQKLAAEAQKAMTEAQMAAQPAGAQIPPELVREMERLQQALAQAEQRRQEELARAKQAEMDRVNDLSLKLIAAQAERSSQDERMALFNDFMAQRERDQAERQKNESVVAKALEQVMQGLEALKGEVEAVKQASEDRDEEPEEEQEAPEQRPEPAPMNITVGPIVIEKPGGTKTIQLKRPDGSIAEAKIVTQKEGDDAKAD